MKIFELHSLTYSYDKNKKILKSINAQMETGKMYAILGPSGCGKTTLLSLLGGLDSPASGSVLFEGKDIAQIGLARHRKKNVSFIFQSYNLIDYLTPVENVALTSKLPPLPILERLGLTKEESKRNVDQMCEILSVSTKTGYALLKKGSVQHLKVGRSYRIPKAHLLTYLIGFAPGNMVRA